MYLESDRLALKPMTKEHILLIHQKNCYPEVAAFNTIGIPKTIERTEALLQPIFADQQNQKRTRYAWTVFNKETDTFVGEIGMILAAEKFKSGEIYYGLLPEQWGKGYASEAAKRVLRFGFQELQLHRIEAGVACENHKSIRLLEKIGMKREGLRRKNLPIRGEWQDSYAYAILEEEL